MCYFAMDGNYGGSQCYIIDTANFTNEDWDDIEEASDSERAPLALKISQERSN